MQCTIEADRAKVEKNIRLVTVVVLKKKSIDSNKMN